MGDAHFGKGARRAPTAASLCVSVVRLSLVVASSVGLTGCTIPSTLPASTSATAGSPIAQPPARPDALPTGSLAPAAGSPTWCVGLVQSGLVYVGTDLRDLGVPESAAVARARLGSTAQRLRGLTGEDVPTQALQRAADALDSVARAGLEDAAAVANASNAVTAVGEEVQRSCRFPE